MINLLKAVSIIALIVLVPVFLPLTVFLWAARYSELFDGISESPLAYMGSYILAVVLQIVWILMVSHFIANPLIGIL